MNLNNFYIGMNGKLHELLRRCEEIEDELHRQIDEDRRL